MRHNSAAPFRHFVLRKFIYDRLPQQTGMSVAKTIDAINDMRTFALNTLYAQNVA